MPSDLLEEGLPEPPPADGPGLFGTDAPPPPAAAAPKPATNSTNLPIVSGGNGAPPPASTAPRWVLPSVRRWRWPVRCCRD